MNVSEAESPSVPFTVTVYVLPDWTLATTKKVPASEVPPDEITQNDELKRPPGFEEIVQEARSSPLLNCPALRAKLIDVPFG